MSSEAEPLLHLHPAAMVIDALKSVRRLVSASALPGIIVLFSQGLSPLTIFLVLLGAVVLVVLAAVWGFLSWRATSYGVVGGAFRLRQGVFQKSERTIPLEHVQSVDTVQGIVQRVFGVYEVRVETAGGGATEPDASLPALSRGATEALRREIEGARKEPVDTEEEAGPEVLRRLSVRDLLVAGATSGQIGVALSLLAVGSQVFDEFFSEAFFRDLVDRVAPNALVVALILVPAVALVAWLLAIAGTVLAHFGFTLSRDGDFLYIKRGLLERREATIPLGRIQAVRVSEGVLRQPFGLASLRVESAGYGEDAGVSAVMFPLLPRDEVQALLREAAPEFAVDPPLNALPRRALRRYVFRACIPAVVLAAAGVLVPLLVFDAFFGLLSALLIPAFAVYGWLRFRAAGWALEGDRLVVRSRNLGRVTVVAPRRRLQSRSVLQSPFQRRVRLATFETEVASGGGGSALEVTDLGFEDARRLVEALSSRVSIKKSGEERPA
ncbi:PH domain-containing protein [Rubrobacter tropicus]|uniref:PH domain-containing protein n=1 Tax=Rubrobacter tropicus TaxID=2653851 RepID=A0A6G8Q5H7_9ACTN|nr:PH domain-containing protein [Rubrobacter tropicus]QIN81710.1 PH domain-containing protein [Rubrobacter tropicus]